VIFFAVSAVYRCFAAFSSQLKVNLTLFFYGCMLKIKAIEAATNRLLTKPIFVKAKLSFKKTSGPAVVAPDNVGGTAG